MTVNSHTWARLDAARTLAIQVQPQLAAGLTRLIPQPSDATQTFAVTAGWQLRWNPGFVTDAPLKHLAIGLIHELWHLLLNHPERESACHIEHCRFAVAADLEINGQIDQMAKLPLPDWSLHPKQYSLPSNLLAEEYAARMPPSASVEPTLFHDGCFLTDSDHGLHPVEIQAVRQAVARAVHAAGVHSLLEERLVQSVLGPPVVPWHRVLQDLLARGLLQAGLDDYSYTRVSRRDVAVQPILLPGFVARSPAIMLLVDTSASVDAHELGLFLREVKGVLRAFPTARVSLLSCDSAVGPVQSVWPGSSVQLSGGGGTDMAVGLQAAARLRPDITIVLTDGVTPWPARRLQCGRIVVGLLDSASKTEMEAIPPWARTVLISRSKRCGISTGQEGHVPSVRMAAAILTPRRS